MAKKCRGGAGLPEHPTEAEREVADLGAAAIRRVVYVQHNFGLRLSDYEQKFVDDFSAAPRPMSGDQMAFAGKLLVLADATMRRHHYS